MPFTIMTPASARICTFLLLKQTGQSKKITYQADLGFNLLSLEMQEMESILLIKNELEHMP